MSTGLIEPRSRPFPNRDLTGAESLVDFLRFLNVTAVNKIAGLTLDQATSTPIPTSPHLSLLGLVKHLTAVQRQHVQIHIGGCDLPALWNADDHDEEFRVGPGDSVASVISGFDTECERSYATLRGRDLDEPIVVYGRPSSAGRLLVDVVQECARHVGHMDIVRELVDGSKGE